MKDKKVIVLGAQVPFIRGGAERLNDGLVNAINQRLNGVSAELIQLPFKWYPETQLIKDMAAWRLVDITETNGNPIDLCIPTKYPTYLASHPNKVTWLVHQHRVFYDLEGSEFDLPHEPKIDAIVREKVRLTDSRYLKENRALYTISTTVSERLKHYNSIDSTPLYPPPELGEHIEPGNYGDYILYIGRVERIKRIEPLINALPQLPAMKAVIVGTGEHLENLKAQAETIGVSDRCRFEGYVSDERYLSLLSEARAVYYSPVDEDYGFATAEALLARKPVITFGDSGEVANIIRRTGGGFIVSSVDELVESVDQLMTFNDRQLAELVATGHDFAMNVNWDRVLDTLVLPYL